MGKLNRDDVPVKPSKVELSARLWHDRDKGGGTAGRDHVDCWCRCAACKAHNPWFRRAWAAKYADICARVGALDQIPLRWDLGRRAGEAGRASTVTDTEDCRPASTARVTAQRQEST